MYKIVLGYLLALCMLACGSAFAAGNENIHGVWKLVSYEVEIQGTGEIMNPMGQHPGGNVIFTPEGRVMFVLTAEGRKAGKSPEEKAKLLDTVIAYSGSYRIEADKWITSVEVAWNPEWVGTEQARNFRVEGDRLKVLTPWRLMPNWADKGMSRSIITFQKSR